MVLATRIKDAKWEGFVEGEAKGLAEGKKLIFPCAGALFAFNNLMLLQEKGAFHRIIPIY